MKKAAKKIRSIVFAMLATFTITSNAQQFIYTSDLHYGISRSFQGKDSVSASDVNKAMIKKMNELPLISFPNDGGVNTGQKVAWIDYVIITGDITNRQQKGIQSASESWKQFSSDYFDGINIKTQDNKKPTFLLTCGNHDVSNAIGYPKPLYPHTDATSMVNIYNMMLKPASPKNNETYNYKTDRINYSRDISGVHFMFVNMWPDSANRVWMEKDLASISKNTPVLIFTHDQPDSEAKHFTNPNGNHDINSTDKFENLLDEVFKDGTNTKAPTTLEQRGFVAFIKQHPNIKAYFHGNDNANEFYTYTGPDKDISLQIIRVDSPMKGNVSGLGAENGKGEESDLSFLVFALDEKGKQLTVRECLWNKNGANSKIEWGKMVNISLR